MTTSFRRGYHLVGVLTLTARLVQEELSSRLSAYGITHSQAVALVRLWRAPKGRMAQSEMARSLVLSPPSTALLLNALEAKGLVRRKADPADARKLVVELTPAGAKLEIPVAKVFDAVDRELSERWPTEDLAQAQRLLGDLRAGADRLRQSSPLAQPRVDAHPTDR